MKFRLPVFRVAAADKSYSFLPVNLNILLVISHVKVMYIELPKTKFFDQDDLVKWKLMAHIR